MRILYVPNLVGSKLEAYNEKVSHERSFDFMVKEDKEVAGELTKKVGQLVIDGVGEIGPAYLDAGWLFKVSEEVFEEELLQYFSL